MGRLRFGTGFFLGLTTGLALYGRIPHMLKPVFTQDRPPTPPDWHPKYYLNGQPVDEATFMEAIRS